MRLTTSVRRTIAAIGATAAIGSSFAMLSPTPAAHAATTCKAYTVLAVRGTVEPGTIGDRLPTTIAAIKARKGSTNVYAQGISYPASFNYFVSMSSGRAALKSAITTYVNTCKSTRIFLIGYSQGAHIVGDVAVGLSAAQKKRIAGIGLIGDPMFNSKLSGSVSKNGSLGGMWGKRSSWPSGMYVTNVCNTGDPVCASTGLVWSATTIGKAQHQKYTSTTYSPVSGRSGANAIGYNLGGRY